jgi:hypothetical protein
MNVLLKILKNKKIIIGICSACLISIPCVIFFNKLVRFSRNRQKLLKILSGIFSYFLYKNQKSLIEQIFDLLIKIKFIQQISIENRKNTLFIRQKNVSAGSFSCFSENLVFRHKLLGVLNISFVEK